jgi:hypothetical protein
MNTSTRFASANLERPSALHNGALRLQNDASACTKFRPTSAQWGVDRLMGAPAPTRYSTGFIESSPSFAESISSVALLQ